MIYSIFDNSSHKNVRTLEYESFNKYLGDKRVKKDELIVVFNKKEVAESFSFFSDIFNGENRYRAVCISNTHKHYLWCFIFCPWLQKFDQRIANTI